MRGPNLRVGPKLRLAVTGAALAVACSTVMPGVARAQPATCPAPGEETVSVVVDGPEAGSEVSGRVEVSGRAEAPTPLFQLELFVGDSRKDFAIVNPPNTVADFTLAWDTSAAVGGPATLRVVACGGSAEAGRLIRGTASVDVQIAPPAAGPARTIVESADPDDETNQGPSLVGGAMIAIPAAAALLFALGRRRSS